MAKRDSVARSLRCPFENLPLQTAAIWIHLRTIYFVSEIHLHEAYEVAHLVIYF